MIYVTTGGCNWIRDTKPQSLWQHMYLGYFALGLVLSYLGTVLKKREKYIPALIITIIIWCFTTIVYYRFL